MVHTNVNNAHEETYYQIILRVYVIVSSCLAIVFVLQYREINVENDMK